MPLPSWSAIQTQDPDKWSFIGIPEYYSPPHKNAVRSIVCLQFPYSFFRKTRRLWLTYCRQPVKNHEYGVLYYRKNALIFAINCFSVNLSQISTTATLLCSSLTLPISLASSIFASPGPISAMLAESASNPITC